MRKLQRIQKAKKLRAFLNSFPFNCPGEIPGHTLIGGNMVTLIGLILIIYTFNNIERW